MKPRVARAAHLPGVKLPESLMRMPRVYCAALQAKLVDGHVTELRVMQPNATVAGPVPYRWVELMQTCSTQSYSEAERLVKRLWRQIHPVTQRRAIRLVGDRHRDVVIAHGGIVVIDKRTGQGRFELDEGDYKRMKACAPWYKRVPRSFPLQPAWCNPTPPFAPTIGGHTDARGWYCAPKSARPYDELLRQAQRKR